MSVVGEANFRRAGHIAIPIGSKTIQMDLPQPQASSGKVSFWWEVTSASIALARFIEENANWFDNKSAVELGCGLGVAGIAAGLLGATISFTDYVPEALDAAQHNAILNGVSNFSAIFLDWEHPNNFGKFDFVLGSEILYDYFYHTQLIRLIGDILNPNGLVLLADRKRLCVSRFLGRLVQTGFYCSEFLTSIEMKGFPQQDISIFLLKRILQ